MSIEFPLARKQTPFGPVSDPKIPVAVKLAAAYVTYRFLVDTGADFSLAPDWLGLQMVSAETPCRKHRCGELNRGA